MWLARLLVAAAVLTAMARAGVMVSLDDLWTYRVLDDAAVTVEDAWREPDFDDGEWLSGIGGFRTGDPLIWDVTQLEDPGEPWITVAFRTRFEVSGPGMPAWLILRADYGDGLAVFLNGSEVARRGMPENGPILRSTPALTESNRQGNPVLLDLPPGTLLTGTNVIVVEVHKSSATDTNAAFKAELLSDFQRGPVVQNLSSNRVTLTWQTPVPTDATVRYGPPNALTRELSEAVLGTNHVVTLTDLNPATVYQYVVTSSDGVRMAESAQHDFRTLQVEGDIQFLVVGDSGSGGWYQRRVRNVLQTQPGDFILHTGDVIYPSFVESGVDLKHFSIYREDLAKRPFFTVFGNHELYSGDRAYLNVFELPTNAVSGTEHYYAFDHGDVHFTALCVLPREQITSWPSYAMEVGSPQYRWLTNDLATTPKPWKVVLGHVPLASSGGRQLDSYQGLRDQLEYQRILLPVFERYGVQLYLAGHDHVYERLGPFRGVHTVVSGGGGYTLYGLKERNLASARFLSRHNIVRIHVNSNRLSAVALDDSGQVIDQFDINRAPPGDELPPAVWHTPTTPTGSDDGDGNRVGQVFDFPGTGVGSVAGKSANLGELQVSADADALYLGLRRVMLPWSQSLALFVELPGTEGVTSLEGLGDSLANPAGQGVEALDALHSLNFASFKPAIGCVLGDEFGDLQARSFPLIDAGVDAGQGVFWLQPGFPNVAGVAVEQFDQSPQLTVIPEEHRADYIILRLPRSLMAPFAQGAEIRLGAVAARAGAALDGSGLVAELDSGYLGLDLTEEPDGRWTLKGISIPLPEDTDLDQDGLLISQELRLGTDPDDPDSDDDGLLDGWEVISRLDPLNASGMDGAHGDPDADHLTNSEEQIAGTDPRDGNSTLRVGFSPSTDSKVGLRWFGRLGRTYNLEVASDVRGPYAPHSGENLPRAGGDREEVVLLPVEGGSHYYRVVLLEQ